MITKEITFKSKSGLCDIWARQCINENVKPKAIIQLLHGMVENSLRYDTFIQELCDAGYAVYMHDHLGHGKSVASSKDLGYFGKPDDAYKVLIEDAHTLSEIARSDYPDLPLVLFGHSMGSFVCRLYTAKYGRELAGAIYCGTGGKNPAAASGIALAKAFRIFKGAHYRCNFLTGIAFANYNKRTENKTPSDWLCRDEDVVKAYQKDEKCGFTFTINGYIALFTMVNLLGKKEWYEAVPANLPILLMAGEEDPVGAYGRGVREVYDNLLATGHKNVSINLYRDDRHEILNELDRDKVVADTLAWIDGAVKV